MSDLDEIFEEAMGDALPLGAAADFIEACRLYLTRRKFAEDQFSVFFSRLGEILLHRGWREHAVACARIAFELRPDEEDVANLCAWVFSNCGRHEDAAAAYERLLQIRPRWAEGCRHISGSLAAAGELDRAILYAGRASELDPHSFEFAAHAASLCESAGRYRDAIDYLTRAAAIAPFVSTVFRQMSGLKFALEEHEEAVALALQAVSLAPEDRQNALHAGELLLRAGRFEEAVDIISGALDTNPCDRVALRSLSAAQMLRGRIADALDAIDRAVAVAPETAEYHVHRGNLLYRLGRLDEAAEAFGRAAALDPPNSDAKRSQLTVYFDSGRFTEALAVGGELIRNAPENEEYAQAVLQVLKRRLETVDGEYVVLGERAGQACRQPRATPGFFETMRTQGRVIYALIIRETRTRFGDSKLGYGWALLEPVAHILMLSLVFAVMMRGRPPIGEEFFIFYYTGIIPYHMFVHTSSSMTYGITSNGSLLQLPLVGTFDVLTARGLLELLTDTLVAAILLVGFGALGLDALPQDFAGVSVSLLVVWLLGCGCGFLNAVINAFVKSWDKIWAQLTRLLYFCSGIFYVPGMMPEWIRDILAWNPLLHAIDWFRSSFFREYDPHWLDRSYLVMAAAFTLLAGLGLERGLQRRLYEPL
ncbi:MAG: tetratricopeptide repeat protein [Alphaproteobacteria bacterium]|nr:tetratricopeptide repeat protein [Alphaproteobacteria bacterium]